MDTIVWNTGPGSLKLYAFTLKNIYHGLWPDVAWAYQNQQFVVCSCASAKLAFHGLCPQVCRSGNLTPVFTGAPPQYLFIFRGRRGDQIKVLWADSDGLCLFTKRLERGRFVWPVTRDGKVHLTPAQLSMLLEGINWKHPKRTERAGIRI